MADSGRNERPAAPVEEGGGQAPPQRLSATRAAPAEDTAAAEPAQFRWIVSGNALCQLSRSHHSGDRGCRHQGMVVVDNSGKLADVITRGDLRRALEQDPSAAVSVLEAGSHRVVVTHPDEVLHDASAKMLRNNIGRLPVVDRKDPRRLVGYLGRPGIMAAHLRRLEEEHVREPGWVKRIRRTQASR